MNVLEHVVLMVQGHGIAILKPFEIQSVILNHPTRFRVMAGGRRAGKSTLAKIEALAMAASGKKSWWVIANHYQAQEVWESMSNWLGTIPVLTVDHVKQTIYFPNGGEMSIRSGHDPSRLWGYSLDSIILDDAAYCPEDTWLALLPLLKDDGRALILSTPKGRNWFFDLYQQCLDGIETDFAAWRVPTSANPFISPESIEGVKDVLSHREFDQDFLAEFLDDSLQVFHNVAGCIHGIFWNDEPVAMGIDWGYGGSKMAIAVIGMNSQQVFDIKQPEVMTWAGMRDYVIHLHNYWQPKLILAEANSMGSPNIEFLQSEGLPIRPFTTTGESKRKIIDSLADAIQQGSISLPDHAELKAQLEGYQVELLSDGTHRYTSPPNTKNNLVMALALALHASRYPRVNIEGYI